MNLSNGLLKFYQSFQLLLILICTLVGSNEIKSSDVVLIDSDDSSSMHSDAYVNEQLNKWSTLIKSLTIRDQYYITGECLQNQNINNLSDLALVDNLELNPDNVYAYLERNQHLRKFQYVCANLRSHYTVPSASYTRLCNTLKEVEELNLGVPSNGIPITPGEHVLDNLKRLTLSDDSGLEELFQLLPKTSQLVYLNVIFLNPLSESTISNMKKLSNLTTLVATAQYYFDHFDLNMLYKHIGPTAKQLKSLELTSRTLQFT